MILRTVDPNELMIDKRELSARLSVPIDERLEAADKAKRLLNEVAKPSYVATRVKIKRDGGAIYLGTVRSESRALCELCKDADECILMAATLGIGADRLIMKASGRSAAEAFVTDAVADAMIEALCDLAQAELTEGITASARFSPGYADLELELGREILLLTDARRLLGISLTEGGTMVPRKSVNAIIAIKNV